MPVIALKIRRLLSVFKVVRETVSIVDAENEARSDLDKRLDKIGEAVLNGDSNWFMEGKDK